MKSYIYIMVLIIPVTFSIETSAQCKFRFINQVKKGVAEHEMFLRQDEVLDREFGSEGELKTVDYIENYFKEIGLSPFNDKSFLQPVPLVTLRLAQINSNLTINGKVYTLFKDYYPLSRSVDRGSFNGEALNAGAGMIKNIHYVKRDSIKVDSLLMGEDILINVRAMGNKPLNVKGKCVLIHYDAPHLNSDVEEKKFINKRINLAIQEGASAIIFYSNNKHLTPSGQLLDMTGVERIPIFFVNDDLTLMPDAKVEMTADILTIKSDMQNVVGMVDNNKSQTILITTHIDNDYYKNKNKFLDLDMDEETIANISYTDDIASLLELARMVSKNKRKFKNYNYIFAVVAGSKNGFIGTEMLYQLGLNKGLFWNYMLNFNNISLGQDVKSQLLVTGLGTSKTWDNMILGWANQKNKYYITQTKNGWISNSDHFIFYKNQRPCLQLTTTKGNDEVSNNFKKNIPTLVRNTYNLILELDKTDLLNFSKTPDNLYRGENKDQLKIEVDYINRDIGVKIFSIKDNSPLKNHDIKPGDNIQKINGKRISSTEDFFNVLENTDAIITLTIEREKQIINISLD